MLILCSNGLSSENLLKNVEDRTGMSKSAAFVFGPTLELVNMYSPELNFFKLEDLNGIRLTFVEVLPHYSKFKSRFDNFEERCLEYEKKKHKKVIRLDDGDGIIIEDDKMILCRG